MDIVVALFVVSGTIGAADILYYHLHKFRLARQPGSRAETVTHLLRSFTFGAGLWTLAGHAPRGGWYWAVAALFAFDFVDEVVDVLIEPKSREPLGGLPGAEYLVHMICTTLNGAAWVTFLVEGWPDRLAPTALVARHSALPAWLTLDAKVIAVNAFLLGGLELALLFGMRAERAIKTR